MNSLFFYALIITFIFGAVLLFLDKKDKGL